MTIQAKDGDHGQPRKIVYDLLTSKQLIDYHLLLIQNRNEFGFLSLQLDPMDYFLLDSKTGELHTARPLDREALPDATGIIVLTVRVCILMKNQLFFVYISLIREN